MSDVEVTDPNLIAKIKAATAARPPAPALPPAINSPVMAQPGAMSQPIPQAQPPSGPSDAQALALGGANGLTMGFAPRIYGAYKAFTDPTTPYSAGVDTATKLMDAAQATHPREYAIADIAGSALPLALGGGSGLIAKGILSGGARGLSRSGDLSDVTQDAQNAGAGAVMGGIGGALGQAGAALGHGGGSFLGQLLGLHPFQRGGQLLGNVAVPATGTAIEAAIPRGDAISNAMGNQNGVAIPLPPQN